jgi:leucyl aminopeptidase
MTGFRNDKDDKTMWVFQDYTDKSLSDFIAKLIKTYVKVPVDYAKCGYGCSDHASWTAAGVPAAFPCETSFEAHNAYIHSALDTIDLLSSEHMANFTKLGLSFAIELAAA